MKSYKYTIESVGGITTVLNPVPTRKRNVNPLNQRNNDTNTTNKSRD